MNSLQVSFFDEGIGDVREDGVGDRREGEPSGVARLFWMSWSKPGEAGLGIRVGVEHRALHRLALPRLVRGVVQRGSETVPTRYSRPSPLKSPAPRSLNWLLQCPG